MSQSPFRMRLIYMLAGLLLIAILSGCAQASLPQTAAGLVSLPAASDGAASSSSIGNGLSDPVDPTLVSGDTVQMIPTVVGIPTGNGLTYHYDPTLASSDTLERIPAVVGTTDSPYWLATPEYRQVTLSGYPVAEHTFKPQIFVYPVDEFKSANPAAAKVIEDLQSLLQSPQESKELPFLPLINAKQVMHVHLQSLDFQNGQGLRYLTQFDQGITPINNHELIYTYQGLTRDGKYYVAAVLPVTHPSLPANEQVSGKELEELASNFPQYLTDLTGALNAQSADSFTPDLAKLDAMMSSLEVK